MIIYSSFFSPTGSSVWLMVQMHLYQYFSSDQECISELILQLPKLLLCGTARQNRQSRQSLSFLPVFKTGSILSILVSVTLPGSEGSSAACSSIQGWNSSEHTLLTKIHPFSVFVLMSCSCVGHSTQGDKNICYSNNKKVENATKNRMLSISLEHVPWFRASWKWPAGTGFPVWRMEDFSSSLNTS